VHCVAPETNRKRGRGVERNQRKGAFLVYTTRLCNSHAPSHHQIKDLAKLLDIWWLRVHIPVEIKTKKDDKDVLDAVKQLCGYLRQILREQMDRRFALGLTFCGTDLSVWLCDRSGLLGTRTPINVHKVGVLYPCYLSS
jgi:hypothetical protein